MQPSLVELHACRQTQQSAGSQSWNVNGAAERALEASTFHDEYIKTKHGYMRYWFVCMAGGNDYTCKSAIPWKMWKRKYADPSSTEKKFKCTECGANYKTMWGVFVELQLGDKICFLRAEMPYEDTFNIKAMDLVRKHKEIGTAQALDDAIPMVAPTETQFAKCLNKKEGQYEFQGTKEEYMNLPVWTWAFLFEMSKGPVEDVAK
jgi:hypothetical protein